MTHGPVNTSLESKVPLLIDRALLFQKVRAFFLDRRVLEVDCPALSQAAPIDLHIDVMSAYFNTTIQGYLHTSAEYGMKRLLAAKIGDIYQMSHVFRAAEIGSKHNPEFMMVEWYRLGISFEEMIAETLDFIRLFLGPLESSSIRYRDAFLKYAQIDSATASIANLIACAKTHAIDLPQDAVLWDKDTLLQLLMSCIIEPHLGKEELFVLSHFPSSQAALAKTEGPVAYRFEVYYQGIELANGYHELTDPIEQQQRLIQSNEERLKVGKAPLKIDQNFLKALEKGLPDCCGVAVGFDRLMMLRHRKDTLQSVIPFTWEEA